MTVLVPIIDDTINEKTETFVGIIRLINAVDPDNVMLGFNATQLIISDNDGKCVRVCVHVHVCVCLCMQCVRKQSFLSSQQHI